MVTLICLLALFCALRICKLAKNENTRLQLYMYAVGLGLTLCFFIYTDVTNIFDARNAVRIERMNQADQSLRISFGDAVKIVGIIESSTDKPANEIIDKLRRETPYLVNRLSTQIDGIIYLLSKDVPQEIIKKMQEKNDLLKKAEESIIACGGQTDTAQAGARLAAYQTAVKVNAELLARRLFNVNGDDTLDVLSILIRDREGNLNMSSEINSPRYSGLDVSDEDLK